VLLLVLS
jgi:hypothetical protein